MSLTKVTYSMIAGGYVNVLDYGAVGDGTTDDTAAIQAATNAAVGQAVYFPSGYVFYIDQGRIDWTSSDAAWVGDGWGSKILWNPATDTPTDNWGMLNIHGTNSVVISKVSIRNLYFDFGRNKNSTYNGYERGIHIFNCNDIEVTGCYFKGAAGEMVGINNRGTGGCQRVLVSQNIFEDYPQNGLNPNGLYQTITGNIFRNGGPGSKIEIGGQYWTFTGNVIHDHVFGLDLSNPTDFLVDGNSFYNVKTGVQFSNQTGGFASYRGVISNNTFRTAFAVLGEFGIAVERGAGGVDNTEIDIIGNTLTGYYKGIRVTSNIYGNVSGNVVDGGTYGNVGIEAGSAGGSVVLINLNNNISVRNTTDYNIAALSSREVIVGVNTSTNGQFTAANTIGSTANQVTLTGSTVETDLKKILVGGSTLPTGQGVTVKAVGETLGTAGNKTIRLYFYNQLVATIPAFATASAFQIEATMWSVSSSAQSWNVKAYVGTTLVLNLVGATTVVTTNNQEILVTGQLANGADSVLLYGMTVEKF